MQPRPKDLLLAACAVFVGVALSPSPAFADSVTSARCHGPSCQVKFGLGIQGQTWYVDIVADNGPRNTAMLVTWNVKSRGGGRTLCSGHAALDRNGHLGQSFPCPNTDIGPIEMNARTDVPVNWHLDHHF